MSGNRRLACDGGMYWIELYATLLINFAVVV